VIEKTARSCVVRCLSGLCGNNTLSETDYHFRATPSAGYADGVGLTARFSAPEGVVFIDNDLIVVADTGNFLIRMLSRDGFTKTLAGSLRPAETEPDGKPLAGCPPPCLEGVQVIYLLMTRSQ
jgi:hypothetical protein